VSATSQIEPQSFIDAARQLRNRGFGIRWLRAGTKRPLDKDWSLSSQEAEDYRPGYSLGLMTGALSSNLVCVDLDSREAIEQADSFLPSTNMVDGRPGKPRSHRWYLVSNIPPEMTSAAAGGIGGPWKKGFNRASDRLRVIDFLGTGGHAVVPPSIHKSGEQRIWCGVGDPAIVPMVELWDAVTKLAKHCGWEPAKPGARPAPTGPITASDAEKLRRAEAYLATIDPAVANAGGHDQTFYAACRLLLGFDLTIDQAFGLLQKWNQKCQPPWSDAELWHKLEDANQKADARGYLWIDCGKLSNGRAGANGQASRGHAPNRPANHSPEGANNEVPFDDCPSDQPQDMGDVPEPPIPFKDGELQNGDVEPNEALDDPHRIAREYLLENCQHANGRMLHSHLDVFQLWDGKRYNELPKGELRAALTQIAKRDFDRDNIAKLSEPQDDKKPPPTVKKVTTRLITDVEHALESMAILPGTIEMPAWLNEETYPPWEIMACENELIHLPSLIANKPSSLQHTPQYFNANVLDYKFDAQAPAPTAWLEFLRRTWDDDTSSIETLQDWAGYLLTADTRQQKILMMLGPRRSGKGTMMRVLRGILGGHNCCAPTLSSLATTFGLWPLLGKTCAVVNDARLTGRPDHIATVVERLLSISGEDPQTVDRKFLSPVTVKLPTRFIIVSNELPRMGDSSGALTGRMILLRLTKSWYGKEDTRLTDRLLEERPGILLWAIAGWQRLRERGYFIQPESGKELLTELEELSSPVSAFVKDCCEIGPGRQVSVSTLFARWQEWCVQCGRKEPGTVQVFGRDLLAALPGVRTTQPRGEDRQKYRAYEGIRLRY
jgi:putative DNA primase/helicase